MPRWLQVALTLVLFTAVMLVGGGMPTASAGGGQRFLTGNDLHQKCLDRSAQLYVLGVFDALSIAEGGISNVVLCVPTSVVSTQISDIACKFISENPASRHLNASALVARSIHLAYPCEKP